MMSCNHLCLKVGKLLFALPFLIFGIFHLMNASAMAGMLAGWPAPTFLVYVSGIGMILASIALLTGRYVHLAMKLLALELLIIILTIHVPAVMAGGEMAQVSVGNLLKDVAIMAGALILAADAPCEGMKGSCAGCGNGTCKMKKDDACCTQDHADHEHAA